MTNNLITPRELVHRLQIHFTQQLNADELVSVYRVAKELGLKNPRVLNWMHGRSCPSQTEAVRIAKILGIEPGFVLACLEAQRQSEPEIAEAWESLAKNHCEKVA